MGDFQLKTPVAFLIFNRPDTTEKVFEAIRQAKPPKLLVVADGPRPDRPGEAEKCKEARAIIEQVDWDCEVLTNYSDVNLGCKNRVSSGLDWVFNTVEEVIILEDDCLPHPTFFRFCEELLDHYRYDNRIAVISGQNVQLGKKRTDYSYYFSRYNHCWGWASWKRAWQAFDFDMKLWSEVRDGNWLEDILANSKAVKYWRKIFNSTYQGSNQSWAFRWTFSCWMQNYLSIISNVNLISNIGFGQQSTHTPDTDSPFAHMPTEPITFPLQHPPFVIRDSLADDFTQRTLFKMPSLLDRAKSKLKKIVFSGKAIPHLVLKQ
jgi:hypothetical protein